MGVQELVLAPQVAVPDHHAHNHVDSPHNHVATHHHVLHNHVATHHHVLHNHVATRHHVPHNHVDSLHNHVNSDHVVHHAPELAHVFQQVPEHLSVTKLPRLATRSNLVKENCDYKEPPS